MHEHEQRNARMTTSYEEHEKLEGSYLLTSLIHCKIKYATSQSQTEWQPSEFMALFIKGKINHTFARILCPLSTLSSSNIAVLTWCNVFAEILTMLHKN